MSIIGTLIRKVFGEKQFARYRGLNNYFYDMRRFGGSSTAFDSPYDEETLGALITMDYHRIEKGLALPAPRVGFGSDVTKRLLKAVPDYEQRFGPGLPTRCARAALAEYAAFHRQTNAPMEAVEAFLATAPADPTAGSAGTLMISREAIYAHSNIDFDAFARHRYSVRNFTGEPVERSVVEAAVATAMKTPSVCNRQTARVHIALSDDTRAKALSYQNGNRGFGDRAGAVLIVTSDMRGFTSLGERNQCWVDGGLFAMSLNYALHARGLGVCMLNWSTECHRDREMRTALGIPDHEAVIMMMAVGHMPEAFKVASSPRRPLEAVASVIA